MLSRFSVVISRDGPQVPPAAATVKVINAHANEAPTLAPTEPVRKPTRDPAVPAPIIRFHISSFPRMFSEIASTPVYTPPKAPYAAVVKKRAGSACTCYKWETGVEICVSSCK